jgi:acetylornithine/succinyldiaminopimelate/putrescine aminotransferase
VNSGSEAVEGALKLAKRATGRHRIFSMKHAYHGSTHGALSVTGDAALKQGYGPMLPEVFHIPYNDFAALQQIDYHTAAVIVEGIQGEAGVVMPQAGYLAALRRRCSEVGALMILDEIQTGFGRTGSLFYLEQAGIVPDILTIAKGMGAGMPIGAFVSSRELMSVLSFNPVLGHITTFGGHPLSAAAALAGLEVIAESGFLEEVREKSLYLKLALSELPVLEIRGTGMMWALRLNDFDQVQALITFCMQQGLLTDWFLFASNCVRIAPPLVISKEEIDFAVEVLGRFFRGEH